MIVYGDHPRPTTFAALYAATLTHFARARVQLPGLARHEALVAAFLAHAELVRALADAAFARHDEDRPDPATDAQMPTLSRLARAVAISWRSRFHRTPVPAPGPPPQDAPATTKPAEGFAFYALYPEAVLEAAHALALPRDTAIVGLRGIGVALAAMAAAALRPARAPITLRPTGHPFARTIAAPPPPAATHALIVDEGPGLSGSSLAAAARWVADAGTPSARITLLTSHAGPPGAMASPDVRTVWAACARVTADFDATILPHLRAWVGEIVGEPVVNWRDLSAGSWATDPPPLASGAGGCEGGGGGRATPTDPARERHKYLATTPHARYLVKFVGLGDIGHAKLARARALAAHALVPEPIGLAHGFLVERWIDSGPPTPPTHAELTCYLAARTHLAPPNPGAPLPALIAMAHANIGEALGTQAADAFAARAAQTCTLSSSACATDNRLHPWEWLRDPTGCLLKADALDHCEAHDLIGCQDIAWDIAGAAVELGADCARLAAALAADPALVALHLLLYPAFQLGLWTMAGHARADFYAAALRCSLTPEEPPPAATDR